MDKKLTKAEFMQKVAEKEKLHGADAHAIENRNKINNFRRKKSCK